MNVLSDTLTFIMKILETNTIMKLRIIKQTVRFHVYLFFLLEPYDWINVCTFQTHD